MTPKNFNFDPIIEQRKTCEESYKVGHHHHHHQLSPTTVIGLSIHERYLCYDNSILTNGILHASMKVFAIRSFLKVKFTPFEGKRELNRES